MKKKIQKLLLVFFLVVVYSYVMAIQSLPDKLVVFQGETINMKTILGMSVKNASETVETISTDAKKVTENPGQTTLEVSLFNNILVKEVDVDILPKTTVIPVGSIAGVKLYTSGVLVVGMSEIEGMDNKKYKPYENTGIKEGDTITKVNSKPVSTTEELVETVNNSNGNTINVTYVHEEETKECSITPTKTSESEYKIGLWVRDSAARSWNNNFL